jgi:hypothetical protein
MKRKTLALMVLAISACAEREASIHLLGIGMPDDNCSIEEDVLLIDRGTLDVEPLNSRYIAVLTYDPDPPPGETITPSFADVLLFEETSAGLREVLRGERALHQAAGFPPLPGAVLLDLVTQEEALALAADPQLAAALNVGDRPALVAQVTLRAISQRPTKSEPPPEKLDRFFPDKERSLELHSNTIALRLELCRGCVATPCDPPPRECHIAQSQPRCFDP